MRTDRGSLVVSVARASRARGLPAASLLLALAAWGADAEVVAPDGPPPEPGPPARADDPKSTAKTPLVVDEPDFKARAVLPDKAGLPRAPERKELFLPQEDGVSADDQAAGKEQPAAESAAREDISAALAKAISKGREGKLPRDMAPLYQAVVEAEPENAPAHYRLGLALARCGDLAGGLAEMEKAVALQPANPKYQCDYGLVALQSGALEKAFQACRAAANAAPLSARYQSALGDCLVAAGRTLEAAEAYLRAVHAAPSNAEYIHNLGVAHIHAGAYKKAVDILGEALRLRPEQPAYYCSRGLARMNQKDIREAVRDFTKALLLDKNNAYAHFLLASAYSDPDDPTFTSSAEALAHAEKAVRLTQGRNAQYLMGLARALRVARYYDKAAETARKAVALEPREDFRKELSQFEQLRNQGVK